MNEKGRYFRFVFKLLNKSVFIAVVRNGISKTILGKTITFQKTIKEILTHDQKCENETCKENGLNTLKVVDVEYIGIT